MNIFFLTFIKEEEKQQQNLGGLEIKRKHYETLMVSGFFFLLSLPKFTLIRIGKKMSNINRLNN